MCIYLPRCAAWMKPRGISSAYCPTKHRQHLSSAPGRQGGSFQAGETQAWLGTARGPQNPTAISCAIPRGLHGASGLQGSSRAAPRGWQRRMERRGWGRCPGEISWDAPAQLFFFYLYEEVCLGCLCIPSHSLFFSSFEKKRDLIMKIHD